MPKSLQVIYSVTEGTSFDYDYYLGTHMPMVGEHIGEHMSGVLVTKGLAGGGPDTPPGSYAIATMTFADGAQMDAAMGKLGPLLADIPNFTDSQPTVLIGEVIG